MICETYFRVFSSPVCFPVCFPASRAPPVAVSPFSDLYCCYCCCCSLRPCCCCSRCSLCPASRKLSRSFRGNQPDGTSLSSCSSFDPTLRNSSLKVTGELDRFTNSINNNALLLLRVEKFNKYPPQDPFLSYYLRRLIATNSSPLQKIDDIQF